MSWPKAAKSACAAAIFDGDEGAMSCAVASVVLDPFEIMVATDSVCGVALAGSATLTTPVTVSANIWPASRIERMFVLIRDIAVPSAYIPHMTGPSGYFKGSLPTV